MRRRLLVAPLLLLAAVLVAGLVRVVYAKDYKCFRGNSMYQLETVKCPNSDLPAVDRASNNPWYCAKMQMCEYDRASGRSCVTARSCAFESQCTDNSTGDAFDEKVLSTSNGQISTKLWCCKANELDDEDDPCNAATPATMGLGHGVAGLSTALCATLVAMAALALNGAIDDGQRSAR